MLTIGIISLILASSITNIKTNNSNEKRINARNLNKITIIILIYASLLTIDGYSDLTINKGVGLYNGLFIQSFSTVIFETFIYIIGAIILIITGFTTHEYNLYLKDPETLEKKIKPEMSRQLEYPILLMFNLLGSSLLMSSNNLITMFLAIELQSYALYLITSTNRNSLKSTTAGLKYFLLGGMSSAIILLGASLMYNASGLTNFEEIYILNKIADQNNNINIGISLIFVGFLFKVAASPFHSWAPDVYDSVSTTTTVWIATIPKIALLAMIMELCNNSQLPGLINILVISTIFSLIVGGVLGLTQYRIKRLFIYSSISNIGFILLAILISTIDSTEASIFYIIQYILVNINLFFILIAYGYIIITRDENKKNYDQYSPIQLITQLKGQFNSNPYLSICLTITLFSFAGIPPLMGFFAKQLVLLSALKQGLYFICIIAIISSVLNAGYYLKVLKKVYNKDLTKINKSGNTYILSSEISYIISSITIFIVVYMIKPDIILNSAQILAQQLYI
jgi:NADH-ubiquinone oxidoreductase chain 2